MATNAEANALGLATPVGTDKWRNGDDAISQNARRLHELYYALKGMVDSHNAEADELLTEAAAIKAYVEDVSGITVPDEMAAVLAGDPDSAFRQTLDPVLSATYVTFTDVNGDPLPPGHIVQIRLSADLTEIDDIVAVEA